MYVQVEAMDRAVRRLVSARVGGELTLDGRPVRVGNDPDVMPGPDDTYQSNGVPWANVSNTPVPLDKAFTHTVGIDAPLIVGWAGAG